MSIQQVVRQENNIIQTTAIKPNQGLKTSPMSINEVMADIELNPSYIPAIQEKTVINAIEKANKKLEGIQSELEFSIHEKTKQIMVKVLDKSTKEIIREIPSEKILDMVAAMCEGAGLFVDEKL